MYTSDWEVVEAKAILNKTIRSGGEAAKIAETILWDQKLFSHFVIKRRHRRNNRQVQPQREIHRVSLWEKVQNVLGSIRNIIRVTQAV